MHTVTLPATNRESALTRLALVLANASPGKEVEVTWKEKKRKRSDAQNRALWKVAYGTLRELTGNDPEDLHEFFLGEHFGWEVVTVMGQKKRRPMRRSSKLNKAEFADFYAFIQRRSAEVGYYVPDPNEII